MKKDNNKIDNLIYKLSNFAVVLVYIIPISFINFDNFDGRSIFWIIILILEVLNIFYRHDKSQKFESEYLYLKNSDCPINKKLRYIEKLIEKDKNID